LLSRPRPLMVSSRTTACNELSPLETTPHGTTHASRKQYDISTDCEDRPSSRAVQGRFRWRSCRPCWFTPSSGPRSRAWPPALAVRSISASAFLPEGVLHAMFITKVKTAAALVLGLALVSGAAGLFTQTLAAKDDTKPPQRPLRVDPPHISTDKTIKYDYD